MTTYRVLTGDGEELEQFDAATDADAIARGREQVQTAPRTGDRVASSDFRVERLDAEGWTLVHAWMPMPPTARH